MRDHHWRKRSRRYWRWWAAAIPWWLRVSLPPLTGALLGSALAAAALGNYIAAVSYVWGAVMVVYLTVDSARARFRTTRRRRCLDRWTLRLTHLVRRLEPKRRKEVMSQEEFNRFMTNLWSVS